jgi:hypothetical protein
MEYLKYIMHEYVEFKHFRKYILQTLRSPNPNLFDI